MNTFTKILIFILSISLIISFCFIIYKQNIINNQQEQINNSIVLQKQFSDFITRSSSQYATKDDIKKISDDLHLNLNEIQKDLNSYNAKITGINNVQANSIGENASNIPSTYIEPNTNAPSISSSTIDPNNFLNNKQDLVLTEPFQNTNVPFGTISFSAWEDKPWSVLISPREYNITTVIGTDNDGKNYTYNKFSINVNNKDYPVEIKSSKFEQEYPQKSFSTNLKLYLGGDIGIDLSKSPIVGNFSPGLHLNLFSYGNTKLNPDLSILQLGIGYSTFQKTPQFILTPISYNIGQNIPILKNTFLSSSIAVSTIGDISIMAGLRVGL